MESGPQMEGEGGVTSGDLEVVGDRVAADLDHPPYLFDGDGRRRAADGHLSEVDSVADDRPAVGLDDAGRLGDDQFDGRGFEAKEARLRMERLTLGGK